MKKILYFLKLNLISLISFGQVTVTNVKASQVDGVATINYDLQSAPNQTYYVKLLYSKDGGATYSDELTYVTGDVKSNITAGISKKIIWNSKQEVGTLTSNVQFKVTAEGKLRMPKPIETEKLKIEFISIERSSGSLTFVIQINPKTDFSTYVTGYTYFIDNKGNKVGLKEGTQQKQYVAGVPSRVEFSFRGVTDDTTSLGLMRLSLYAGFSDAEYEIRNVQLPTETN